jgi:hypothetical protein
LTVIDPLAGGNRHIDLNNFPHPVPLGLNPRNSWVPDCKRRRVDLRSVITDVFISPWAEQDAVEEIKLWAKLKTFPVKHSELTSDQTPTLEQFKAVRHLGNTPTPEPEAIEKRSGTKEEQDRFFEVLSGLTPSRVRFLYRERWETCRLNPGSPPQLIDIQYLETTLRVLDAWRRQGN